MNVGTPQTHVHIRFQGACAHRLPDRATNCTESDEGRFGESKIVRYFVDAAAKLSLRVYMLLADVGYDTYAARKYIIGVLKAVPLIALNPRGIKGRLLETRMKGCRKSRLRLYIMNGLTKWWGDMQSNEFNSDYDPCTLPEQVFSIGKRSLKLDSLKH